jgi:hypothetical protein
MNREEIGRHLPKAADHITLGEQVVTRQRAIVSYLAREGLDTSEARFLLTTFEEKLRLDIAGRDRLRRARQEK